MAIGTDSLIDFFGTLDDLDSSSAAVTNTSFSVAGDLATWTNDDDATEAFLVGLFTFGTNPTAGSIINVYLQPLDIADTTKDQDAPSATNPRFLVASFPMVATTSEQVHAERIRLPNGKTSQEYQPWIYNVNTGQTLSAGWSLQITPITPGPHA